MPPNVYSKETAALQWHAPKKKKKAANTPHAMQTLKKVPKHANIMRNIEDRHH